MKQLTNILLTVGVAYGAITNNGSPLRAVDCGWSLPPGCTVDPLDNTLLANNANCCACWGYKTQADRAKNQDLNISVGGADNISKLLAELNDASHANNVFGFLPISGDDSQAYNYFARDAANPTVSQTGIAKADLRQADGTAFTQGVQDPIVGDEVQVSTGEYKGLKGDVTAASADTYTVAWPNYTGDSRAAAVKKVAGNGYDSTIKAQIKLCAPTNNQYYGQYYCSQAKENVWTTQENHATQHSVRVMGDKMKCRNFGRSRTTAEMAKLEDKSESALCIFEFVVSGNRANAANDDDHEYICRSRADFLLQEETRGGEKAGIWILIVFIAFLCAWPACQKWPIYKRVCNTDSDLCCKKAKAEVVRRQSTLNASQASNDKPLSE